MKSCLLVLFLGVLGGATITLFVDQTNVKAAGNCQECSDATDCLAVEGVANDGQGQNCCNAPTLGTDILKFKTTRTSGSGCKRTWLVATARSGSTCDFGSDLEPAPEWIPTCWDGTGTRYYTDNYYIQRISDSGDGTLTVEVQKYDGQCASIQGTFVSNQTALCENCTDPGDCTDDMCDVCR